ncbi:hypothetical protein Tco_0598313 [Tanacetum coccineum]
MDKTRVMENVSLLTHKHLFITTTDKHGVPPTKRLFRVPTLDPSPEFIVMGNVWDPGTTSVCHRKTWTISEWFPDPQGFSICPRNIQSRVKRRTRAPTLKNAVFDLSFVRDYPRNNAGHLEESIFLLGCHSLDDKFSRMFVLMRYPPHGLALASLLAKSYLDGEWLEMLVFLSEDCPIDGSRSASPHRSQGKSQREQLRSDPQSHIFF